MQHLTNYKYILYFAWADQRDKVHFIFHKVARGAIWKIKYMQLCGKYSTVMQISVVVVVGVKFLTVTTVIADLTKSIAYSLFQKFYTCHRPDLCNLLL